MAHREKALRHDTHAGDPGSSVCPCYLARNRLIDAIPNREWRGCYTEPSFKVFVAVRSGIGPLVHG